MIDIVNDLYKIEACLKAILEKYGIKKCKLKLERNTVNGGGFISNVTFASLLDVNNPTSGIKLVLKCLGNHATPTIAMACSNLFQREIFVYTEVMPAFRQLEVGKQLKETFNSVPTYFGFVTTKTDKVLILENMLSKGYSIWPKNKPLTLAHTELLLKQFAKWHAFSFALKDQKPEYFEKIVENKDDFHGNICQKTRFFSYMRDSLQKAVQLIEGYLDTNELTIYKYLSENFGELFWKHGMDDSDFTVLCHGDCWNNNFMFRYQDGSDNEEKKVIDLCILDWQCATMSSPVYDLCHIMYVIPGKEQLDKMAGLLHIYYQTFSNFLRQLGSDPARLYPLDKFKEHWNKYSFHGVMHAPSNMKHCMSKDISEIDFLNLDKGNDNDFDFVIENLEDYKQRLVKIVKQYVRFKFE